MEILAQLKKYYGALLCDPVKYCSRISEMAGFGKTIRSSTPLARIILLTLTLSHKPHLLLLLLLLKGHASIRP